MTRYPIVALSWTATMCSPSVTSRFIPLVPPPSSARSRWMSASVDAHRGARGRGIDRRVSEVAGVVQERQEKVEQQLAVGIAPNVAPEKFGQRTRKRAREAAHAVDRPGMREEPLPVAKGVRIFRPKVADRCGPHMPDEHVGSQVFGEHRYVNLGAFVDGPTAEEHLARLVETNPPAERRAPGDYGERLAFELEDARAKVRSVTDEAEESRHRFPPDRARRTSA